jgi:hypothetical protein
VTVKTGLHSGVEFYRDWQSSVASLSLQCFNNSSPRIRDLPITIDKLIMS